MRIGKAFLFTFLYYIGLEILSLLDVVYIFSSSDNYEVFLWIFSFLELVKSLIAAILLVVILKSIRGLSSYSFKFRTFESDHIFLAIGCGFLMVYLRALNNYCIYQLPWMPPYVEIGSGFVDFQYHYIPEIIATTLVVPVTEELLFRGYLFKKMLKKYEVYLAIALSSILFAAVHANFYSFGVSSMINTIFIFLAGLIAGSIYLKTRKIMYPILFHVSWSLFINLSSYLKMPFL